MPQEIPGGLTQVPGFLVGHASDYKNITGCTVVLCPSGTLGSIDIRGSAAGTRQIDALLSYHIVNEVQAVLLAGGSAFGLDAAGGVMEFLEEQGRGFDVSITKVPTVPTAVIFDLALGNCRVRPDKAMGYTACVQADGEPVAEGSIGVGTGASVGKLFGINQAMKGGVGSVCLSGPGGLLVAPGSSQRLWRRARLFLPVRLSPALVSPPTAVSSPTLPPPSAIRVLSANHILTQTPLWGLSPLTPA